VARFTALESAARSPGGAVNGRPVRVTKPATGDGARMRNARAGIGRDAKK